MKKLMEALIVPVSGGAGFQRLLELNVSLSQYLMGIGSGSCVHSSGEKVLADKLSKQYAATETPLFIFDVGANKGQFLRIMENGLQSIHSSIHIHAFEPDRHAYKTLCDYAANFSNVTLNNIGLGKQIGEFEFFYDQAGSGLASLSKRRLEHIGIDFKYADKITIDTLDNYCISHAVPSIDLLKLDVEGHELDVLQGGLQMFRSRRVRMVSFEFGGCNIDSRTYFQDFYYFFKDHGMRILRITPSGHLVPLYQYKEIYEQFRTTNFLVLQA